MAPEKPNGQEKQDLSKRRRLDFKGDRLGAKADRLEERGKASKERIQKIRDKEAEARAQEQEENEKIVYERTNFSPFKRSIEAMGISSEAAYGGMLYLKFPDTLKVVKISGDKSGPYQEGELIFSYTGGEHITGFASSDLTNTIRIGVTDRDGDYTVYEVSKKQD